MIRYLRSAGLVLLCMLGMAAPAAAVEVNVGQTKLELLAPKGFCPLERSVPIDSGLIDIMQQAVQGRNEVLAAFAECGRLKAWRAGEAEDAGDVFSYVVSLKVKDVTASVKTHVSSSCALLRKQGAAFVKGAGEFNADRIKDIKALAGKVELNGMQMYGVLHEDDTGCYFGTMQKYKFDTGVETTFSVKTITVIKGKLIFTEHEDFFKDAAVIKRLLTTTRETIAAVLARNR